MTFSAVLHKELLWDFSFSVLGHNTAAKRTAHEYEFELPVETHFRLCIKIQCKQDKIPYREV